MSARAVVIGGGLAGLAAALELARRGWAVTIVEKNTHLGGKMNLLEERGFSFDMGPTILTLPQVLRGIIERSGRRVSDYIDLVPLDPQWRCFYEDGTRLDLWQDPERMSREITEVLKSPRDADGYRSFVNYSRRMLKLSEKVFFYKDLGGIGDLMRKPPTREPGLMREIMAMRIHSTVAATAHKHVSDPRLRQLVEHFLQYVGSSPFLAPAILTLIAAAQVDYGCWYSMGGTRSVARALERILREEGAEIITGAPVRSITVRGDQATGVELADGRTIEAECVVSNCDVQRSYGQLCPSDRAAKARNSIARRYTPACSGVVLYLGLDRQYPNLLHHNFMFSRESRSEFDDIYRQGIPARDPSLYVCAPSRTDPGQAPAGCEALYVLIHTPYLRSGQRWEGPGGLLEQYRPVIIEKMKRMGMPDLEQHIVVEKSLTPAGIDRLYNAEGGAIYGLASHGRLSGGFKPRNRSRVLKGLYLAGGSVNPGPGVPMVLMSGVTAANSVCEDLGEPGKAAGERRAWATAAS